MKLLFVMRHAGYVRLFESTLRLLCDRGHHVHLAFQATVKYQQLDPADIAGQFAATYPKFSHGRIPLRRDGYGMVGRELRLALDYLRYLEPAYVNAPKLVQRARRDAPAHLLERADKGVLATTAGRRVSMAWLRALEQSIPRDATIDAYMRDMQPDVLAVTPLIEPGSPQADFVRSARAAGVRTAVCVASWDNLTNKGLIHGPVDLVTVWNEAMKREAIEMHGIPARRIAVTGAAGFDHWFTWKPGTTREAFCARVGLPAGEPYLLYVGSSKFVAPEEAPFVREWIEQIRQAAPAAVRRAGILIRPHPQNAEQWREVDLTPYGAAVVWPRAGAAPVDDDSRNEYFDSIYHAAAVVGVNTTAEIESAIVGRPVFTILAPQFRDTQEGTLHFHYLRQEGGGAVTTANSFQEHVAQIDAALSDPSAAAERCRRFVEHFVRPHGLDVPATPRMVAALEQLAEAERPRDADGPFWAPWLRSRLERRSRELEQIAQVAADAKAVRVREAKRLAQEAKRRAKQTGTQPKNPERGAVRTDEEHRQRLKNLEPLVDAFWALGAGDRRLLLREVSDAIPPRAFIDMHAASAPRKLDYPNADILMRVTTDAEEYRLRACAKEPFTVDWIHRRIGPGDVLYDIGANVGAYSLVAAKKPGGGARVFAFEPSYMTVATLSANVVLNGLACQVTPIPVALSDRTGMTVFNLGSLRPGSARHALGHDPEDGPAVYQQPVMVFRLDDLVDRFDLPKPNHIKLDVDGGELEVLDGAAATLASESLQTVLIEVSTSLSDAVTALLGRHGLQLASKISVKNKAGEYAVWYGMFVRGATGPVTLGEAPPR